VFHTDASTSAGIVTAQSGSGSGSTLSPIAQHDAYHVYSILES
jgi:hypothetical protein